MKSIDIIKVSKKHKPERTDRAFKAKRQGTKSIRNKKLSFGLGFGLLNGVKALFDGSVFMFSFLRNTFSLRPLFFIFLPLIYFEFRYLIILKPDQILSNIKSVLAPQNTFQFVVFGLAVIIFIIISWLLDTFVVSALMRYNFQKLDHRKSRVSKNINDIIKNTHTMVISKVQKKLVLMFYLALFCLFIYGSYVLGYGSLENQISLYISSCALFLLIYALYVKFRFSLQVSSAVGLSSQKKKFRTAFGQALKRPLRSISQAFVWILLFAGVVFLCFFLAYLLVNLLISSDSIAINIVYLSSYSVLIYILWSGWTSFSTGYWSSLVNYEKQITRLVFYVDQDGDYFAFCVLATAILIVLILYFVLCFIFSSEISEFLVSIWNFLPETVKINIPKPN